jgi:hypothetical protein
MASAATAVEKPRTTEFFKPRDDMALIEAGRRNLETASEVQRRAFRRAGRVCDEGLRFVNRRVEENYRAMSALAGCQGLPEVVSVWSQYVDTAVWQYRDEFGLLAGLCSDQLRDAVEDLQHEVA